MSDIDDFFQALNQPGVGTIWIRMGEVKDWLLQHSETLETLKREALGCGFVCTEERITRDNKEVHCIKIEKATPCFKPSRPVLKTDTAPSK